MGLVYSSADLVVSRAGALTIAEMSFYGLAAILIPYPGAGGHQYANACYLESRSGCMVMTQEKFSFDAFKSKINDLLFDEGLRKKLGDNLSKARVWVSPKQFGESFKL